MKREEEDQHHREPGEQSFCGVTAFWGNMLLVTRFNDKMVTLVGVFTNFPTALPCPEARSCQSGSSRENEANFNQLTFLSTNVVHI